MNGDSGTQQAPENAGSNWQFKSQDDTATSSPPNQPQQPGMARVSSPSAAHREVAEVFGNAALPSLMTPAETEISWTASEYVDHDKSASWYMALGGITLLIAAVAYLMTKDFISVGAIIIFAIIFGVAGSYKPRVMSYHIGPQGLSINNRLYPYQAFKTYGVMEDGAFPSIVLTPMKRFLPATWIYYPPNEGEKVVAVLSQYLPVGPIPDDALGRALRHIRF